MPRTLAQGLPSFLSFSYFELSPTSHPQPHETHAEPPILTVTFMAAVTLRLRERVAPRPCPLRLRGLSTV